MPLWGLPSLSFNCIPTCQLIPNKIFGFNKRELVYLVILGTAIHLSTLHATDSHKDFGGIWATFLQHMLSVL